MRSSQVQESGEHQEGLAALVELDRGERMRGRWLDEGRARLGDGFGEHIDW
jgi:hypothetical protein